MTDPIRAALETAAEALERVAFRGTNVHTMAANQAANAAAIARAALAAAPPAPDPTINDIFELCEDHEFHLGRDGANEEESAEGLLQIILVALARWGNQPPAPAPHEVLAVRQLMERIAQLGDVISGLTVGEVIAISAEATGWLAENPSGQPPAPAPVADHLRTATEMVADGDGEREELAALLIGDAECLEADQPDLMSATNHQLRRAADLLRQPAPTPEPPTDD